MSKYLVMLLAAVCLMTGAVGCKAKKKLREAEAAAAKAEAEKIARAKAELLAILNDDGKMSLEEKEEKLAKIQGLNLKDPEVLELIIRVQDKLTKERAQQVKEEQDKQQQLLQDQKDKEEKEVIESASVRLDRFMNQISNAGSVNLANSNIREALNLFASDNSPVLIIIHESGGEKDYDRPTTIRKYLEYLKDQKKQPDTIENVTVNSTGKITELELRK